MLDLFLYFQNCDPQMGSNDEYRHHLVPLISSLTGQYIERDELDHRLNSATAEIMENMRRLMASSTGGGSQVSENVSWVISVKFHLLLVLVA